VVTHPTIFETPTPTSLALEVIAGWMESDHLRLLSEGENHFAGLQSYIAALNIKGPRIHDARIAVLCAIHGVQELWSMDRDFSRFPFLKTHNPLV
jgi:predicted nucleic acid-binding protein